MTPFQKLCLIQRMNSIHMHKFTFWIVCFTQFQRKLELKMTYE